ncbi:putative clock controled protein (Ccg-8) [Aspergillus glaucus CBS 516.65]|uniref:Clock-controlled protein 8 n=1 Tax=Aspergillus glaucus CBS 516.65 TaxID=1160497 RepID=A0A1L9VGU0_ASPGL|nr:hypothetical protein ASPGLDRAFT_26720 [Aspergillus glaucus CBS 516.65]OJJ83119.1 hypothetical protein ASPGLDRAFT_26720 [Aspergillus glaucus CBS 516.65]
MADGNPPTPIPPASTQQHPQAVNAVNNHTTIISPDTSVQHAPLMEVDNSPDDRSRRATSVLSMDDIEAAQALEGLRSEFAHSPRSPPRPTSDSKQAEPLLSLLTSTHPLISSAITGSMTAYTTSKSYSPRFKTGAEFIERNIGSPVASTVGTVGRKTGVESGLRWALKHQRGSTASRSKRRKVNNQERDLEKGRDENLGDVSDKKGIMRTASEVSLPETLPPYDDHTSPSYDEVGREKATATRNSNWQSRLVISTSGLGVAMSEESLRSLQYCLTWLRWANGRLGKAILALQGALKEWDSGSLQLNENSAGRNTLLSQRIQAVRQDVLHTLKQVVNVVSKYAGGALPENARNLVRKHLTSLPHRFQIASTSQPSPDSPESSSDATVGAHRILVLAQEGLDMMAQVSGVVNDTLVSAEHWCDRLGRKRPERGSEETPGSHPVDVKQPVAQSPDVQMTGVEQA